jgi:hypothetical protein
LKAKHHPGAKAFSAGPPAVGGNAFGRGTGARVLYGLTDFEAGGAGDRETFWSSLSPLLCMGVLPFMCLLRRSLGRGVIFVLDLLNAHRWAAREYRRRAASVEFEWLPPYAQDLTPVEQV